MNKTAHAAPAERLLTVNETAGQLRVSRWQIYALMRSGDLAYVQGKSRSGGPGYRKVEQAEIDRYIADNRVTAQ